MNSLGALGDSHQTIADTFGLRIMNLGLFLDLRHLWTNRGLIWTLTKRDVAGRYKGSFLGYSWTFINPLLMLIVYTFVFTVIFRSRWGADISVRSKAIYIFCGMVPYLIMSETVARASTIITSNANYIKKIVFPHEILCVSAMGVSLVHGVAGFSLIFLGQLLINRVVYLESLYLPIILIPLLLMILGVSWFLASLGVFIRDISEIVRVLLSAWMFLTPIFYPMDILPEKIRAVMLFNPMALVVINIRNIVLRNQGPDWMQVLALYICAVFVFSFGYWFFMRSKNGFADVI